MIKFGPSGNDDAFYEQKYTKTLQAPKWLSGMGLSALELSFGRGVNMGEQTAEELAKIAKEHGITISIHAPYYINFANTELAEGNLMHIKKCLDLLKIFGTEHIVVHAASQGKVERDEAMQTTKTELMKVIKQLEDEGYSNFKLCLETMGRYKQIGTYQEIAELCSLHPCLIPCVDFGHINCIMQGALKTKEDYLVILNYLIDKLGREKIQDMHIHFSKIKFNDKGEMMHLTLEDDVYGPEPLPLLQALKELELTPLFICESKGTQARDAQTMKDMYSKL